MGRIPVQTRRYSKQDELYDEWGREFLAEGRRRTDLIRWGLYCTEEWWDKKPDADSHWDIFPIPGI